MKINLLHTVSILRISKQRKSLHSYFSKGVKLVLQEIISRSDSNEMLQLKLNLFLFVFDNIRAKC